MTLGIDVSPSYQPVIDWRAVKAAGYDFGWLKVTEGIGWPAAGTPEAAWWWEQAPAARAAGLTTGGYHFGHPSSNLADADAQAAVFAARLTAAAGDLVPMLDLETNPDGLSAAQLIAWARRFLFAVDAATGARSGLYTDVGFLRGELAGWNLDGRPLWLADPSGVDAVTVRQATQLAQRTVPGIAGLVDVNTADQLPLIGRAAPPAPSSPPPPTPSSPPPAPAPDWTVTVRNVDLRAAATTPVRAPGVEALQLLLRARYAPGLAADGVGGPLTRATLLGYQQSRGLGADAIAGPLTYTRLIGEL